MAKIVIAASIRPAEIDTQARIISKGMKAIAKSKFGTSWAVFRDPANAKYLICRRSPTSNNAGQWGFPGGGVDEGESHAVACRRETSEEIKVDIALKMFHPVMSEDETNTIWFEVFQKVAPKKTEEVDMYKWVFPYELDQYDLHKSVRNYFKSLRNHIKGS
jgi:8-oxo-dGTP pyrophosphatase MutT (NUDIX family)